VSLVDFRSWLRGLAFLSYGSDRLVHVSGFVKLPVDLASMPPGPELGAVLASDIPIDFE
jgi:hypothetical protein